MKRCKLCARKLDDNGNCKNEKCPECIRAKINKAAEESTEKEANK